MMVKSANGCVWIPKNLLPKPHPIKDGQCLLIGLGKFTKSP